MPVAKGTVAKRKQSVGLVSSEVRTRPAPPSGGACVGQPTDWWYEPYGSKNHEAASRLCAKCPVNFECLMYAVEWEPHGLWGGLTENQRDQLRKTLRVPKSYAVERLFINKMYMSSK